MEKDHKELINNIISENNRRISEIKSSNFNPITGEGSILERKKIIIEDFPIKSQWLPIQMFNIPLVKKIARNGSIRRFMEDLHTEYNETDRLKIIEQFVRLRCKFDFAFWAATFVYIKNKGGGDDVLFNLTLPQRRFVSILEKRRIENKPIRIVLLKARQWGGSTTSQLYMAWLQLLHKVGLNSLIIAHQSTGTDEIKDMFDRMIDAYPVNMLYDIGEKYNANESKLVRVGNSGAIFRVPQRNCKIKLGTAERPNSCRGGDYNLVHISEVGVWKKTENNSPEEIVRSACSGILLEPYTMIVYESTANGTGNFFQREYDAAKDGKSQFDAMFVPWFEIEKYTFPIDNLHDFALNLIINKDNNNVPTDREESGKYLWNLWENGATLEGINWYIQERSKYTDHGQMASEYPSDDVEAFVHSGARVFDKDKVNQLKHSCRPPKAVGDVVGDADCDKQALDNLHFVSDKQSMLWIWQHPESFNESFVSDRYLTVVDVGGRSAKSDYSVIVVFDRFWMIDGDKPTVVAQWYGHIDMDLLAWKAAQIAAYYNNSLLVIESNTLETHDRDRNVEGDQSQFILSQIRDVYPNLYARRQSEEEIRMKIPQKYGFHTNVATKPMVISTLVKAIRENLYIERDERCLNEYLTYEKKQNGSFGAILGKHDDLLMTRAIGLHICFNEMEMPKIISKQQRKPSKKSTISVATI